MRAAALILVLLLPGLSHAAEAGSPAGFSVAGGIVQMIASLAIVIGVIFVFRHFAGRIFGGGTGRGSVPRYIRVVESRYLAPKKSLMLVEVGGEYLLLGSTGEGLGLIKQIDMLESIEVVEDLSKTSPPRFTPSDAVKAVAGLLGKRGGLSLSLGKRMV